MRPGLPADRKPRHLLGIGDIDDLLRGVELGDRHLRLRHAHAAGPPRRGASCPTRTRAGASTWPRRADRHSHEPILDGCPCPACAGGYSRAYLRHLLKAGELLGQRLVTLHNLTFVSGLMAELRAAIAADRLADAADAFRRGSAPAAAPARPAS